MAEQKYPQDEEKNEYRYIDYGWLDEVATGLTAGAKKHPGETWRDIPSAEHAARALRHLSMEREEDQNYDPEEIDALREENKELWAELNKYRLRDFEGGAE